MDRVISQEQGHRLANTWNAKFLEASAKQNEVILVKVLHLVPFYYLFFINLSI